MRLSAAPLAATRPQRPAVALSRVDRRTVQRRMHTCTDRGTRALETKGLGYPIVVPSDVVMHKAWGGRGLRLERAQVHRLWSVGWEARTCPSARPKCKTFLSLHVDSFERQRDEDHTAPVRRAGAGVGRGWGPTLSRHRKLMTHTFVKRVVALEGLTCRIERSAS